MLKLAGRITQWDKSIPAGYAYAIAGGMRINNTYFGTIREEGTIGDLLLNISAHCYDDQKSVYEINCLSSGVEPLVSLGSFEELRPSKDKRLEKIYRTAEASYKRQKKRKDSDEENREEYQKLKRILVSKGRRLL